jgi:hypothetical protein
MHIYIICIYIYYIHVCVCVCGVCVGGWVGGWVWVWVWVCVGGGREAGALSRGAEISVPGGVVLCTSKASTFVLVLLY